MLIIIGVIWVKKIDKFEDCRKAEVAELWDKVIVWSSLWSSVSNGFRDVNLSAIL